MIDLRKWLSRLSNARTSEDAALAQNMIENIFMNQQDRALELVREGERKMKLLMEAHQQFSDALKQALGDKESGGE